MTLSLRDSAHLISDPENLKSSVLEVFDMMLGVPREAMRSRESESDLAGAESVTAVVGFGGILSGACVITCDESSARQIASRMTGMEFESLDDVVKDAVGELCNMVAGTWKSKVPDLASSCGLSVPAVISGRDYNLHMQSPEFSLVQMFTFDGTDFRVSIVCDELL
ncbi:chemotaxis protein CheX [Occallatibacter savannae]|uniref:chemotaxis protein CheX n=1 Tax=Occallatibacter savannae TaxID=1002691 RepID=UPI0013A59E66|nr:chemotaxis protein CheX [Occallatibacter savannae]